MKLRSFVLLLISGLLLLSANMQAQKYPIQVQTILTPPMPEYYSELVENPNIATVVVQNIGTTTKNIKFRMVLSGHNGITIILPETVIPSYPLTLAAHEIRTLSTSDIFNMYPNLSEKDLQMSGINLKDLVKSQRIPDGSYSLCVRAFDSFTSQALSMNNPGGCSNNVITSTIEPPVIIQPVPGDEVTEMTPQNMTIRWTPVQAPGALILYDIKIVVVPFGVNPYSAMRSSKFTFHEVRNYAFPFYIMGPGAPAMVPGNTYAIQVRARDLLGAASITNNGRSEVVTFRYVPERVVDIVQDDFVCGTPCVPPDRQRGPDIRQLDRGQIVQIGYFRMKMEDVTRNGNIYSGTGVIQRSSFFQVPVRVEFSDLRINRNGNVYAGTARASQNADLVAIDFFNENAGFFPSDDPDDEEIYRTLFNPATSISRYMSEFVDPMVTVGVSLPLVYGNEREEIAIVGMEFTPMGASMDVCAFLEFPTDMNGNMKKLIFGASDLCITPGGLTAGDDNMRLNLLNEVELEPSAQYSMHFIPASGGSGCFAEFSCDGLEQVHLGGYMVFNRDHILPVDDNGSVIDNKRFGAGFQTTLADHSNWVMQLDLNASSTVDDVIISNQFQFTDLDDFVFRMGTAYFDHSLTNNPVNMRFPNNYSSGSGNGWEGVYVNDFEVLLPDYFKNGQNNRIRVEGHDMIIDSRGLSVGITGRNLMTEAEPGNLKDWDFTISRLDISILRNRFRSGSIRGIIKPEIIETAMPYSARMSWANNQTSYDFTVTMGRRLEVPMWEATMNLDRSSSISMRIRNGQPRLSAVLNGELSLNEKIGDIEGLDIKGLHFENLRLSTSSPRISGGNFDLEAGITKKIGAFDVTLDDIGIEAPGGPAGSDQMARLNFDLGFAFGENTNGFSATGGFSIAALRSGRTREWAFDGISMDAIQVEGSTSVVSFSGLLEWYTNDAVYGNGFRGAAQAVFTDAYGLQAEVILGEKSNYDYWFVDGAALFNPPIPLVGVIGLNAFGGGAFYNMTPRNGNNFGSIGSVDRHARYVPSRNGWGFKALAGIATSDGYMLSGQAVLETAFGRGGSLRNIRLDGDFYLLKPPAENGGIGGQSMITLRGTINYNHIGKVLDASLGYRVMIPIQSPLLQGDRLNSRVVQMHISRSDWYLYLGSPGPAYDPFSSMVNLNIGFTAERFGRLGFDIDSYFDIGNSLPTPPPLPSRVASHLGDMNFMPSVSGASGVMAGLHAHFELPEKTAFSIWGNGVKLSANAGMGIDMALRHLPAITCGGQADFGINNWYAEARGYLYGGAELTGRIARVNFNILSVSFQSALMAQLPNPTSLRGSISATVGLPVYGDYNMRVGFKVGDVCEMENDESFTEDLVLENMIEDLYFSQDVDSVNSQYPRTYAITKFTQSLGTPEEYELAGGDVLRTTLKWTVRINERTGANSSRNILSFTGPYTGRPSQDDPIRTTILRNENKVKIYFQNGRRVPILSPDKEYDIVVRTNLMYSINNEPWQEILDDNNQPVTHTQTRRFLTKKELPPKIRDIHAVVPGFNEPFVHLGDIAGNIGFVEYENEHLLERWGAGRRIRVKFTDMKTGEEFTAGARKVPGAVKITYTIPNLKKMRIYKIDYQVKGGRPGSKYKNILTYYFQTSYYNTLMEKYGDIKIAYLPMNVSNEDNKYYKISLRCREAFAEDEMIEDIVYDKYEDIISHQKTSWHQYRIGMINYATGHGITLSGLRPEFVFLRNQSDIRRKLTPSSIRRKLSNPSQSTIGINYTPAYQDVLVYFWMPNHFVQSLRTRLLTFAGMNRTGIYDVAGREYQPFRQILGRVHMNMITDRIIPVSFLTTGTNNGRLKGGI